MRCDLRVWFGHEESGDSGPGFPLAYRPRQRLPQRRIDFAKLGCLLAKQSDGSRYYDHPEFKEKALVGQSGKQVEPDSLQPFAGALPAEADETSLDGNP